MAGIYIHIPFCKQACYYCNFHFATSLRYKNELLQALLKETRLRKDYLGNTLVETIYFGGGTPSLLTIEDLKLEIEAIRKYFIVSENAELTLEANPDDITEEILKGWKAIGINRLSIGIQSFFEEDLQWMNRAHTAQQAIGNLQLARQYFDNITIDLIYGTPQLTDEKWKYNVDTAIAIGIPHLSCYALTVEPKTPLQKMIDQHRSPDVDPDKQSSQFLLLMDWMEKAGYEHYEISNFAKPGWRSRHNSSYWQGAHYLGLGPSAHSFNGHSRQWNIANNQQYIESISKDIIPYEIEELTPTQQLNEYIMTALRTMEGIDLQKINKEERNRILSESTNYLNSGLMKEERDHLILTKEGRLLADGIAAALFR
ncbi:MAG TPA: radical SAM family heme chaperone HemW [Chitinophagaceae bacterium]|jgi:oxygen-independent coproporphyrinogen-3 oxidase|nr:radical SAM family heme chaperone HemW [Chitinophagaceae bacterium]